MSQLLRVATAGSVDDGKSTLIGRLLYDSKAIFEDQWDAVERSSRERGGDAADLALLTDGLRAEREQGITIDVAYRYFSTPRRTFIIADTPGHVQYTRNMVTGASTADLALILVDARAGVLQQTKRHAFLASLLGIAHLVLCINKMDLVDWSEDRFEEIKADFAAFAAKLDVHDLTFVPMCARDGDNVVHRTQSMPWYTGASLLHLLEDVHVASDRNLIDARFPVQYVVRPRNGSDFRGLAGTVAGGTFAPGDDVVVLPSGFQTTIAAVWGPGGASMAAGFASSAVCIELGDALDVGRGDMLCRPNNRPEIGTEIDAMVCWLAEGSELRTDDRYMLMHTTNTTVARITRLDYRLDVDTLHRDKGSTALALNDIGRVRIRTQNPLFFDPYRRNRVTGSFLLVDETTGATVAAGMIGGPALAASNVVWHAARVERENRATRGATVWLTGLSASGKSTIAAELERILVASGRPAYRLDGDNLRHGLNSDLGFDRAGRSENVRRVGEVAELMSDAGLVAIACLISPYRTDRDEVRRIHERAGLPFFEVYVDTPVDVCAERDPKGMYAKARAGEITGFTGVDDPYETPDHADLVLHPSDGDPTTQAARIVELLGA
ncbi:adenylyl-sulfate kinase [Rhodococcoides kyotonense]|uniref:Adenylyl-sulfate kinase n=1 Tax=Rhodococcoides kyotonense TaxID=398843 RepID=A0A239HU12_9NOCA|nr:adenylyl-sulfate kinase [Rhodococcus kyotonensis]SNS84588.1 bifunctional enzyme CysN/CysC [Rhodococcus kyotonensis]